MLGTETSTNWNGQKRAAVGARPENLEQVAATGWDGWVNEQLDVPSGDDANSEQLLADTWPNAFDWDCVMSGPLDMSDDHDCRLRSQTVLISTTTEFAHY